MSSVRRQREKPSFEVHSISDFQIVIKRERDRCDREASVFSVIGFYKKNGEAFERYAEPIIQALIDRVRLPDEIGWFDRDRVGVLLPSTNEAGAVKIAADIQKILSRKSVSVSYSIFSYPSQNGNPGEREWSVLKDKIQSSFVRLVPPWKRPLDIAGSLVGLVFFSPLFLLLTAYIRIVSPGPVLFKQKRVGCGGKQFTFLKFRTMKLNNDTITHRKHLKNLISSPDTPMEKLDHGKDPRIIFGGRIIRKLALDELPQFVNILKGEMSLVGPRPCIPYEAEEYLRWHRHRFDVLPGLTGLWQVSGKNRLTFKQMIRLDIAYGKRMSFWLDIKILLLTLPSLASYAIESFVKKLKNREFKIFVWLRRKK